MPSTKTRLALTLSDELRSVLFDLADASSKPASKVVTDLLQELIPQLQGLVKIARATKSGNQAAAKRALQHMVGDTMAELMARNQPEMFKTGGVKAKKAAK